jgi:hypothetical protein
VQSACFCLNNHFPGENEKEENEKNMKIVAAFGKKHYNREHE